MYHHFLSIYYLNAELTAHIYIYINIRNIQQIIEIMTVNAGLQTVWLLAREYFWTC
jgi:hypothetical protein